jgi:hypothetical protein
MIKDAEWNLYGQKRQGVRCVCIDGYEESQDDPDMCSPKAGTQLSECTQLKMHGALSAESGDDDETDFAGAHQYNECEIFLDCNMNMIRDTDEHACTMRGMRCVMDMPIHNANLCRAMIDPSNQPAGYSCPIAQQQVGVMTVNTELLDDGAKDPNGLCPGMQDIPGIDAKATFAKMFHKVPAHIINGTVTGQFVFDPGEHEDPSNPNYPLMGWCDLCWSHGCGEIEDIVSNTDMTKQSSKAVHWDSNTFTDTIAACLPCTAPSSDPNKCSFQDPEVQAEQWPVCDDLCIYNTCEKLSEQILAKLVDLEVSAVSHESVKATAEKMLTPLCWDCSYGHHMCVSKPVDYNPATKTVAGCDFCSHTGGVFVRDQVAGYKCYGSDGEQITKPSAVQLSAEQCIANGGARSETNLCGTLKATLDSTGLCPAEFKQTIGPLCCTGSGRSEKETDAEEMSKILGELSPEDRATVKAMNLEEQLEFMASSPAIQLANFGFSTPISPSSAEDAPTSADDAPPAPTPSPAQAFDERTTDENSVFVDPWSNPIDSLPADQAAIYNMMPKVKQEEFLTKSPAEQVVFAGFSLPPTAAPAPQGTTSTYHAAKGNRTTFHAAEDGAKVGCKDAGIPSYLAIDTCEAASSAGLCKSPQGASFCMKTCGMCNGTHDVTNVTSDTSTAGSNTSMAEDAFLANFGHDGAGSETHTASELMSGREKEKDESGVGGGRLGMALGAVLGCVVVVGALLKFVSAVRGRRGEVTRGASAGGGTSGGGVSFSRETVTSVTINVLHSPNRVSDVDDVSGFDSLVPSRGLDLL